MCIPEGELNTNYVQCDAYCLVCAPNIPCNKEEQCNGKLLFN